VHRTPCRAAKNFSKSAKPTFTDPRALEIYRLIKRSGRGTLTGAQRDLAIKNLTELVQENEKLRDFLKRYADWISHEFGPELSGIHFLLTHISLVVKRAEDLSAIQGVITEGLDRIENQCHKIGKIGEALRRIALANPKGLGLAQREFSVHNFVQETVRDYIERANRANVDLKFNACDESLMAYGDEDTLKIALSNLLKNAIRYNRSGGWVQVNAQDMGKGLVAVRIVDNGQGVPLKDQPHIFEDGRRGSNVLYSGGTGVGLTLAKEIIEKNNGKIGFISQENQGSTFFFEIPLKPPAQPPRSSRSKRT
jgi:signal transduction histidine kinase